MVSNTLSLTRKTSLSYHFGGFSSKPTSRFNQKLQSPLNSIQVCRLRACSTSFSYSRSLNYAHGTVSKNFTGSKMGFGQTGFCLLAVSAGGGGGGVVGSGNSGGGGGDDDGDVGCGGSDWPLLSCFFKRLESTNTIKSSIWWFMRFYWTLAGGHVLMEDSPGLFINLLSDMCLCLCMIPLVVFFIIFCIGLACFIFLATFCFIPVLAIADDRAVRRDASEDDISSLPKYRYCHSGLLRTLGNNGKEQGVSGSSVGSSNSNCTNGRVLLPEDSECCICLCRYIDGAELYSLACNHHFHCGCISRWLRINATCPLCKFNICSGDTLV